MKPINVTVIVVNWNGEKLLAECLASLCSQTYTDREIILVDNGSTDNSVEFAREKFPGVRIVALSANYGFTGGNIEGLNVANGRFIALVNNDARADEAWLENLIRPMLSNPDVGVCASKVIFNDGSKIDSAGQGLTTSGVGFNRGLGDPLSSFNQPEMVFGACGAAVLYRRRMLDQIGFLDADFFLYDEDTDLNFRAQLAGWQSAYVPSALVYHKANATSVRLSDIHVYYHTRNLEWVWLKNMPVGLMLRFAHHKIIQEVGSFCYLCLRHGKWAPYFRAKRDALKKFPVMWQRRRQIQAERRLPIRCLCALLSSMFTRGFVQQKLKQMVEG